MRKADIQAIECVISRMRNGGFVPRNVLLFSPAIDMTGGNLIEMTALSAVWPDADIQGCDKGRWDLNYSKPTDVSVCDIGLICNTFMCSLEPDLWLRHISTAVPILIIQDLAVSQRSEDRHCSVETGDVARYSISSHGIIGKTDPGLTVFDFSRCGYELLDIERCENDETLTFVAVLKMSNL